MKIIANTLLALASMLICQKLVAQDSLKHKSIKVYSDIRYTSDDKSYTYAYNSTIEREIEKHFNISLSPAIAFYNKKGNFHEIGFPKLSFNSDKYEKTYMNDSTMAVQYIYGNNTRSFDIELRYEYNIRLLNIAGAKLQAFIGLSASPFFSYIHNIPVASTSFPYTNWNLGTKLSVVPRFIWNINPRLFMNIDMPLDAITLQMRHSKIDNPAISEKSRKFTTVDFDWYLPPLYFRVGIGINI